MQIKILYDSYIHVCEAQGYTLFGNENIGWH